MSTATTEPGVTNMSGANTTPTTEQRILLRPAPHIHSSLTVQKAMLGVVASLLPASIASIILFGVPAALVLVSCMLSALASEALCLRLRGKPVILTDGSALVTGLLLALTLPSYSPVWMCILGGFIAIGLGKHLFGGLGANPFNPALVARVFLLISFPDLMTRWVAPFDAATSATPLAATSITSKFAAATDYLPLLWGNHAGSLGETSTIALLAGGLFLLVTRIIDWRIPVAMFSATALTAWVFGANPAFHLMSGGLMLGAFFMATDWVTSPVTRKGRLIFGAGIGLMTMVIRLWGNFPEGVSFAILFMNAVTPLLNEFTRPHPQMRSIRKSPQQKESRKALIRIVATMTLIASLAGGVLAVFYGVMNPRIEERRRQEMEASFRAIFPAATNFQPIDLGANVPKRVKNPVYLAQDAQGEELGITFLATPPGFQGDITLAIGLNREAQAVAGVKVLAHTETANLGSKVAEAPYLDQYTGKSLADEFLVRKDIDGISGATISSAAVANGVRDSAHSVLAALATVGR